MATIDPHLSQIAVSPYVEADVEIGYSDEDIILIDNVKLLTEPSTARLRMNMVVFFVKGRAQGDMNGHTLSIGQNQLLICPPNVVMSNYMLSPDFEMKALFVSDRVLQRFLREKMTVWTDILYIHKMHIITLEPHDIEFMVRFYELLKMAIGAGNALPYQTEVIHSMLRSAFLALCGVLKAKMPQPDSRRSSTRHSDRLFQQFVALLGSTPVKHRTVESYASELCITPKYLSVICHKHSGKSANAWITEHVMEDIRYYLKSSDLSIKEVCMRLGFPNASFFGKYVKDHFGMTPTQLRSVSGER